MSQPARQPKVFVRCEKSSSAGTPCGKLSQVSNLTLIQTHYYISPYSCTGGDYWLPGDREFVCPECGHLNRLRFHSAVRLNTLPDVYRWFGKVEHTYSKC